MRPWAALNGIVLLGVLFATGGAFAKALDTNVALRVRAHDAKFVGSHVGEMNVVIEDADTGALLM